MIDCLPGLLVNGKVISPDSVALYLQQQQQSFSKKNEGFPLPHTHAHKCTHTHAHTFLSFLPLPSLNSHATAHPDRGVSQHQIRLIHNAHDVPCNGVALVQAKPALCMCVCVCVCLFVCLFECTKILDIVYPQTETQKRLPPWFRKTWYVKPKIINKLCWWERANWRRFR